MDDVLDEFGRTKRSSRYSRLSLIISLVSIATLAFLFLSIPKTITAGVGVPEPSIILVRVIQFSCTFGVVVTMISYSLRELSTWFKWVGGTINLILFLFLVGSTFFSTLV